MSALEKSFNNLQHELQCSVVTTKSSFGGTEEKPLYNRRINYDDFYSHIDKLVSSFFTCVYNGVAPLLLASYLRRWRSIKPDFIYDDRSVLFHRRLENKSKLNECQIREFIRPFLVVQFNTYIKVEDELILRTSNNQNNSLERSISSEKTRKQYITSYKFKSFKFTKKSLIKDFFHILQDRNYIKDNDFINFERNFSGYNVKGK